MDSKLLPAVVSSDYHNILLTDHAPVSLDLRLNVGKRRYNCRFDNTLLDDGGFCQYLPEKIATFLGNNDKGDVDDSTLGVSMKAVIRGDIMSFQVAKNKKDRVRLEEIDKSLGELETHYRSTNDEDTLKNLVKLRCEYNSILSKKISNALNQIKQKQFKLGDKPHKLLARQLKQIHVGRAIHSAAGGWRPCYRPQRDK